MATATATNPHKTLTITTTGLSSLLEKLKNAMENRVFPDVPRVFPDVDAVMESLKDLDDYIKLCQKCDIHIILYGDDELLKVLFHVVAPTAKTLIYESLKWMDAHDLISDIDAKLEELFWGTDEYDQSYKPYSVFFRTTGIPFPDNCGKSPTCKEERRERIKGNMLVLEFHELCNYMLKRRRKRDALQGFVDRENKKSKASGDCVIESERVRTKLLLWKEWNEGQVIPTNAPKLRGGGINTKMRVLEFNKLCNYMLHVEQYRDFLHGFVDYLTKCQAYGDCLIGPEHVKSQLFS